SRPLQSPPPAYGHSFAGTSDAARARKKSRNYLRRGKAIGKGFFCASCVTKPRSNGAKEQKKNEAKPEIRTLEVVGKIRVMAVLDDANNVWKPPTCTANQNKFPIHDAPPESSQSIFYTAGAHKDFARLCALLCARRCLVPECRGSSHAAPTFRE